MPDLLLLTHRIPYPPNKGDKLRSYHLLKFLSARYRVHLGCFIDDRADVKHIGKVKSFCYETCFIEQSRPLTRLLSLRGLLTGEALSLPYYRDGRMREWVSYLLRTRKVEAALAFSSPMAQYLGACHGMQRVIDFVDVDSEKWRQYGATARWPWSMIYRREAARLLTYERATALSSDHATFVSDAEAILFQRLAPESHARIASFNNGVDADYFSPHIVHRNPYGAHLRVIVFTGAMDYWPNIDAATWFAREVFAPLHAQTPSLRFYVVGQHPSAQVSALERIAGVVVTGSVPDVRPYLAHAALAVAPLRLARGIQNKVLEAMSMQKTVVCSPQALEGIDALVGSEVLVASESADFQHQIRHLLDTGIDSTVGMAARARVLQSYNWQRNLARVAALLTPCAPLGQTDRP